MKAPIILFVYNRPHHTQRALQALLRNAEAAESKLYVFSDGPRTDADAEAVAAVRRTVHAVQTLPSLTEGVGDGSQGFAEVEIVERTGNWGLARNVIDGVTTVVNRHGRVIVVEDDLVVAPHFLQFMNDALELYADEPRVGHIHACDFTRDATLPDTFLIKFTGSWGWATWARAWQLFNADGADLLRQLRQRRLTHTFDFNGRYPFTRMLRRQVEGKNNSWAIRWNASLFLADVLSLNVGRSLVSNEGFDGSGTHCGTEDCYTSNLHMQPLPVQRIEPTQENLQARRVFQHYYARTNSLWSRAKRRLRQIMQRR